MDHLISFNKTIFLVAQASLRCIAAYSLHQKKVYTCGKAKYSKSRVAREKQLNGGFGAPLLFIWLPSVLSARLDKSVYFLLGETVSWGGNRFSQNPNTLKFQAME